MAAFPALSATIHVVTDPASAITLITTFLIFIIPGASVAVTVELRIAICIALALVGDITILTGSKRNGDLAGVYVAEIRTGAAAWRKRGGDAFIPPPKTIHNMAKTISDPTTLLTNTPTGRSAEESSIRSLRRSSSASKDQFKRFERSRHHCTDRTTDRGEDAIGQPIQRLHYLFPKEAADGFIHTDIQRLFDPIGDRLSDVQKGGAGPLQSVSDLLLHRFDRAAKRADHIVLKPYLDIFTKFIDPIGKGLQDFALGSVKDRTEQAALALLDFRRLAGCFICSLFNVFLTKEELVDRLCV